MFETALTALFSLSRPKKRAIQLVIDIALMFASFFTAMALRLETLAFGADRQLWIGMGIVVLVSLPAFIKLGFYRAVIRYITAQALVAIFQGIFVSVSMLIVVIAVGNLPVPATVPLIYGLLALVSVGGVRFVLRAIYNKTQMVRKERVIIYGAGDSGRQLLHTLKQGNDCNPIAFFDDDPALHGMLIGAVEVLPPTQIAGVIARNEVTRVLLAMPSASRRQRSRILKRLEPLPVHVQTIPGIADILSGRAKLTELRDVAVEDLLGREPVPPREDLMDINIRGKVVMVTGAGGSIGSELCRQIAARRPSTLVLYEQSEYALYSIERDLADLVATGVAVVPVLGSVRDPARTEATLRRHSVETLYHAAAYKHVPLVEHNPVAGVENNVLGTDTLARAAIAAGVASFILVSTDKAVRPTSIMGASKRMAELICQARAQDQRSTRFSIVRFGNVLDSSGSVIPQFRRQIAEGGPITVTHNDITRYFMTIPEAAQLVIQAGAMARGGDVFVLDMGKPVKIVELAMRMVRLHGLKPYLAPAGAAGQRAPAGAAGQRAPAGALADGGAEPAGDIPIVFCGLRPGEKLFEELMIGTDAVPTDHPRILTAHEDALPASRLDAILARLRAACAANDAAGLRTLLCEAPTGFRPDLAEVRLSSAHDPAQPATVGTAALQPPESAPAAGQRPTRPGPRPAAAPARVGGWTGVPVGE